jgi:2-oxoglutarate dehydrogenase E1 component
VSDDILSLANSLAFLDGVYELYSRDPNAVDPSWRRLFSNGHVRLSRAEPPQSPAVPMLAPAESSARPSLWPLVNAFRVRGHLEADLDPLDLLERPPHPELEPASHGIAAMDMEREGSTGGPYGLDHAIPRQVLQRLRDVYCRSIGLEFMHISTPAKKAWLAERMETRHQRIQVDVPTRIAMLERLISAQSFEGFVHKKYPGTKRFSLEGS